MTRLIDADKLRKVLSEPLYRSTIKDYGEILKYTFVMDIIDNAPTVAVDNYSMGYQDGVRKVLSERPQGEWIECTKSGMPLTEYGRMTGEKWYGFKCSQCNFIYKGNALIESPFCQKCGANMWKGGVE